MAAGGGGRARRPAGVRQKHIDGRKDSGDDMDDTRAAAGGSGYVRAGNRAVGDNFFLVLTGSFSVCDQMSLPPDFVKLFVLHVGPKEVVCEGYG